MFLIKFLHVICLDQINIMKISKDILFVSTADWDNPFWTNKQHVAVELENLGHRILYIDSQGLRKPTATGRDIKRIIKRLFKGLSLPKKIDGKNIWVCSPLILPFHDNKFAKILNKLAMRFFISYWKFFTGLRPSTLWTYSPLTTSLYDIEKYDLRVYHAVDDIKAQPGMPYMEIQCHEKKLAEKVDYIFTTALKIQDELSKINPSCYYFSNVADFNHFSKARNNIKIPRDISLIETKIVGFVGAISSYKVDFHLIKYIANNRKNWTIVMIGEIGEGDPNTNINIFNECDNVLFLGAKSYKDLPNYIKKFDVAMIPCHINQYTKSMFPMKFFEYLAAGVNVVTTDLPALQEFKNVSYIAKDYDEFLNFLEISIDNPNNIPLAERDYIVSEKTYTKRMELMLEVIENEK